MNAEPARHVTFVVRVADWPRGRVSPESAARGLVDVLRRCYQIEAELTINDPHAPPLACPAEPASEPELFCVIRAPALHSISG